MTDNYLHYVILYTQQITPRLTYISDFIGNRIIGQPIKLTTDKTEFLNFNGPSINYSETATTKTEIWIRHHPILFEENIREQKIDFFQKDHFKYFFKTGSDYQFDIFAASFYLLSRYEEYLPHKKDMYGRYDHGNSLAFKEDFLHLPLVNIWIEDFKNVLLKKFPSLKIQESKFRFLPTYDIDEAYAFKSKSLFKNLGGSAKSILKGEWKVLQQRINVFTAKERDPYDSFDWLDSIHAKYDLHPIYFFHVAIEQSKYDKNISPYHESMQELIKKTSEKYPIAIHPSWKSGDDDSALSKEIRMLEKTSGKKISKSRQHYIRFTLPDTFRKLIKEGITEDYSMGYGSINGFRASVASPHYWFNLEKNEITDLLLHPFCFMEANSFFEQKYLPQRAYEEMMHYFNIIRSVNGTMITIWHNNFLGTYPLFLGWRDIYESFLKEVNKENN